MASSAGSPLAAGASSRVNIGQPAALHQAATETGAHEPEHLTPTDNAHSPPDPLSPGHSQGILTARPTGNPPAQAASGSRRLGAGAARDGLLRIPGLLP